MVLAMTDQEYYHRHVGTAPRRPMDKDFLSETIPAAEQLSTDTLRKAALTVASQAVDALDCATLLDMLGLTAG